MRSNTGQRAALSSSLQAATTHLRQGLFVAQLIGEGELVAASLRARAGVGIMRVVSVCRVAERQLCCGMFQKPWTSVLEREGTTLPWTPRYGLAATKNSAFPRSARSSTSHGERPLKFIALESFNRLFAQSLLSFWSDPPFSLARPGPS